MKLPSILKHNKLIRKIYKLWIEPILHFIDGFFAMMYLRDHYEGDIVVLGPAIGDDVYGLAYLKSFKALSNNRIVLVGSASRRVLYETYHDAFDELCLFEKDDALWRKINLYYQTSRFLIKQGQKINIYSTIPIYYLSLDKNQGRDALDIIRNDLLHIGNKAIIEYPHIKHEAVQAIENFDVIKDKIVVLNPYSGSMIWVDNNLFERIAVFLTSKGFYVYTNVVGEQSPIKGTQPLNCSIYELYAICNHIPFVISVRSGIIDFCVTAKSNFLVYYFSMKTKAFQPLQGFYNTYTLSAWQTNNVVECIFESQEDAYRDFLNFYNNMQSLRSTKIQIIN